MMKQAPRCAFCDSENTGLASVRVTCNDCSHSYEYDVPNAYKAVPKLLEALKKISNGDFTFDELRQGRAAAMYRTAFAAIAASEVK